MREIMKNIGIWNKKISESLCMGASLTLDSYKTTFGQLSDLFLIIIVK